MNMQTHKKKTKMFPQFEKKIVWAKPFDEKQLLTETNVRPGNMRMENRMMACKLKSTQMILNYAINHNFETDMSCQFDSE